MLIAIAGEKQSGKDTATKMLQYLLYYSDKTDIYESFEDTTLDFWNDESSWENNCVT